MPIAKCRFETQVYRVRFFNSAISNQQSAIGNQQSAISNRRYPCKPLLLAPF